MPCAHVGCSLALGAPNAALPCCVVFSAPCHHTRTWTSLPLHASSCVTGLRQRRCMRVTRHSWRGSRRAKSVTRCALFPHPKTQAATAITATDTTKTALGPRAACEEKARHNHHGHNNSMTTMTMMTITCHHHCHTTPCCLMQCRCAMTATATATWCDYVTTATTTTVTAGLPEPSCSRIPGLPEPSRGGVPGSPEQS